MAVLRRLGAASGRKMNFDDLCVCVCMSRTGCSPVKAVVKDQIWIRGFPGCWNCLKVGTDVIFFRIRLELVCKVVLFFYPECVGNGESPESEAIFTLGDWCLLEFNLCCLLPAIKKNNKTKQNNNKKKTNKSQTKNPTGFWNVPAQRTGYIWNYALQLSWSKWLELPWKSFIYRCLSET